MKTFTINNLRVSVTGGTDDRLCYILSPFDGIEDWVEAASARLGVAMALICGIDWDNALTPWPAPGVPEGSPDFKGEAPQFLATLQSAVMPRVESLAGIAHPVRTLTGVSLSGLFTLWQWMECDLFDNIISISGSFWYEGFADWVTSRPVPKKGGRAIFLLGNKEAKSPVPQFRPVQTDTERIFSYLKAGGIDARFELVAGNHYQHGEQRLLHAFAWMFGDE